MPRPNISPKDVVDGRTGTATTLENKQIIEEYSDYFIGFAEFDDQGWSYSNGSQLNIINRRIASDLANPNYKDKDFLVLVFVHGWHHNAHDNDSNVQQFRQMVDTLQMDLRPASKTASSRHIGGVIGNYVGCAANQSTPGHSTTDRDRSPQHRGARGQGRRAAAVRESAPTTAHGPRRIRRS